MSFKYKIMQVILLAAGRSARLDPITDKNRLEFCGKPLIEHRVAALKKAKLRDIVVVGNKDNAGVFRSLLKKYNNVVVTEQKNLEDGMAGGVLAGAKIVNHKNILILSANDVVEDELIEKAVQESKKVKDGLMVGKKVREYFPGGYLKIDKEGVITDIMEKPGAGKEPSDLINIVLHVYNDFSAFVKILEKTKGAADGRYEKAVDQYIKKDKAKLSALKYNGYWQPIKFPWHILRVMECFFSKQEAKIDKTATVSKQAVIKGNVVIGPKAVVMENAVIQGPAYIGMGTVIGNNTLVRGSMVGGGSVIGFGTEVARSYLNHEVWTHATYVGDSIVDSNVSFGSGTVLGNLRFDEENVKMNIQKDRVDTGMNKFGAVIGSGARFGINSCTNPGVKIGRNVFVGGNVLVEKDVPDDKMILLEQRIKIVSNGKKAEVGKRGK